MRKYEAMFIVSAQLTEDQRKNLFNQFNDVITKNEGQITASGLWSEKRNLYFPLRKQREGQYYLVNFDANPPAIAKIKNTYRMNESILRVMITVLE